jgi:hypothetical protein
MDGSGRCADRVHPGRWKRALRRVNRRLVCSVVCRSRRLFIELHSKNFMLTVRGAPFSGGTVALQVSVRGTVRPLDGADPGASSKIQPLLAAY